jgi:hypothetical protein
LINGWQRFFSHFVDCAEAFKFDAIPFVHSFSYFLTARVLFREFLPMSISSIVSPIFSSSSFTVSDLTLRSVNHFESMFVQSEK